MNSRLTASSRIASTTLLSAVALCLWSYLPCRAQEQDSPSQSRQEQSQELQSATDLQQGAPLQVEDTETADAGSTQVQVSTRYDRTRHGENEFEIETELQRGLSDNTQASIAVPYKFGSGDKTGSGDLRLRLMRRMSEQSGSLPAFALVARADLPTGRNTRGIDTALKLVATRSLEGTPPQRLHFNAQWMHNAKRRIDERSNQYQVVFGYDRSLGTNSLLLLDFVREQQPEKGETENLVELGIRRTLSSQAVLGLGVGAGIGEDSPHFRVVASFETQL
ncbi:MAG TPA: hypothetical protein VF600_00590 [Abditibacteriaceae bacterium]|jgi:hypothetical protein